MKAVVMAGGSGSRLRPLTIGRPKPMVPIVNKPVLGHIRDLLRRHGITDMVITLQYMADVLQHYFGDGRDQGMRVFYSIEEVPLGTAGSVRQACQYLDSTFLVISGDALTNFDLTAILKFHKQRKARATVVLCHVPNPLEYGAVITSEDGRIVQFQEKPSWGEVISDTVNTGMYVLEPDVLDLIEPGIPADFAKDLFPAMLERGDGMYGYVADGYWGDIGNVREYMQATRDVLTGAFGPTQELGRQIAGGIWVDEDVEIARDAQLYGPIYLGQGVKIKGGAIIQGPTVLRDFVVVDNKAQIERSIIWRNTYVGEGAEIRGAVICRQCNIKSNATLFEGVVVGDNTIVGSGATLYPDVKIWPGKEIESGAAVKSSIIWGSQGRKVLFSRYGVTGLVNVDLTPESAARLGAAFAATLPKKSTVIINRDPHRSPRMIKRAIISGVPSAGVNVLDTQSMPIPVACYYTRSSEAAGGVHVRLSPYDNRVVDIRFFDKDGQNLSKAAERAIEHVFFREDFRRVFLDDIGTIAYAPQVVERYVAGFLKVVDVAAIQAAQFNLVVDYASAPSALVLPPILTELGCNVTALNANIDENRLSILREELNHGLGQLAAITSALGSDLGVRLDVGGERIFVVDDRGRQLSSMQLAAAITALALKTLGRGTIAVPANAPRIFERLVANYEGRLVRTRVELADLMSEANKKGVILACDGLGNFIFPAFQPAVDGLMAVAKLLEFLATQKTRLSDVVDDLPPYHTVQRRVVCPWDQKGSVMRHLNEQYRGRKEKAVDGVEIGGDGEWVLILPDPDEPVVHIYAESASEEDATRLADKFVAIVKEVQGKV